MGAIRLAAAVGTVGLSLLCLGGRANAQVVPELLFQREMGKIKFKLDYSNHYAFKVDVLGQNRPIDYTNRQLIQEKPAIASMSFSII